MSLGLLSHEQTHASSALVPAYAGQEEVAHAPGQGAGPPPIVSAAGDMVDPHSSIVRAIACRIADESRRAKPLPLDRVSDTLGQHES